MSKYFYFTSILMVVLLAGCGKQGPEGKKSLIDLISEAPGPNCANGGYKIVSGIDLDNNNVLDASEIQTTKYICNGVNGNNSLAALVPEPAGPNCTTGGYKLNTGIDINGNNVLDANEITNSQFVCNGITGSNSLVALVAEPVGLHCPNGGYKVNSGTDVNKNGILEESEIQSSTYLCNGNNGLNYLISVKAEPAGNNCKYGGYNFNTGIDTDKNGVLDVSEITGTVYVCNNTLLNEIRIQLYYGGNTDSAVGVSGLTLNNFNKANYPGLDSIVFVGNPYVYVAGETTATFELFNMADNVILEGSALTSNQAFNPLNLQTSKNLYNVIPNKSINIGARVRSGMNGKYASVSDGGYLILLPKNKPVN